VLEHLVVLEEPANLAQDVRRQLRLVGEVGERRIAHADGDDLVVDSLFVAHPHHADGAGLDDGQRIHRLLAEHQRIERVPVVAVGARDEAVVGRIVHGAVEDAIQPQEAGLLVQLVLVLAALLNLDDDGKGVLDERVVDVTVMPRVHDPKCTRPGGCAVPAAVPVRPRVRCARPGIPGRAGTRAATLWPAHRHDGSAVTAVARAVRQPSPSIRSAEAAVNMIETSGYRCPCPCCTASLLQLRG
jgi:hypothetical protein